MADTKQRRCEVFIGARGAPGEPQCGQPATMRYPSMGGSHMHLCPAHGAKHNHLVDHFGERWNGSQWVSGGETP